MASAATIAASSSETVDLLAANEAEASSTASWNRSGEISNSGSPFFTSWFVLT